MNELKMVIEELKKLLPGFEERAEQTQMMEAVYEAMISDTKVAVHAPTGTGKSLGYLIPFIAVKIQKPEFTMSISTFSISLQEQLERDIQLVNQIYKALRGKNLREVTLKGKANYFCHDRYDRALGEDSLSVKTADGVNEHVNQNRWDRQNLGVSVSNEEWNKIKVESCLEEECPYAKHCTYFQSYFNPTYDVYIVNHSLFMTRSFYVDGAWDHVDFNIFDEAHKLEKVMLDSRTFELSVDNAERWASQGYSLAIDHGVEKEKANTWIRVMCYEHKTILSFKKLSENIRKVMKDSTGSCESLKVDTTKMKRFLTAIAEWQKQLYVSWEALFSEEIQEKENFKEDKSLYGISLLELNEFLSLSHREDDAAVIWFEKPDRGELLYKVTPKSIQDIPNPYQKGLVLTSGTLAQGGTCSPIALRLGISLQNEKVMPTPFPLSEQTKVYVASDINPTDANHRNYENLLAERILELIKAGDGKTFVLFTSKVMMKNMYNRLKDSLHLLAYQFDQPMRVWLQEKDNYKTIVESFQTASVRSILFGTLTYFEGIDLKGDSLTQLILTRLPFSVPDHPVQQILDRKHHYSQWEANIRFEQAFGRLIRTKSDYGSFAILDNRIMSQRFKPFLSMFELENIPFVKNIEEIKQFHKEMKRK